MGRRGSHSHDAGFPSLIPTLAVHNLQDDRRSPTHGPIFEPLSLPRFEQLDLPTAYVTCRHDLTLPSGTFHPGQSSRLTAPRLIEIDGDHEALFTAPDRLAGALLTAIGEHA
jgi:hypothetical protein